MITFIVPTIGRKTLERTVNSIKSQSCDDWKCIIIFDGIKKTIEIDDDRISYLEIEKTGEGRNSAGGVRNKGMELCTTEWIGFVDDDDCITPHYVESLKKEIELKPDLDCVIFRMNVKRSKIIPLPNTKMFVCGSVGISFSMKTSLFKSGIKFIPSSCEDFLMLTKIKEEKHKIVISPYITYLTYQNHYWKIKNKSKNLNRSYINY